MQNETAIKQSENDWLNKVDEGIKPAVEILNQHGFKTFESCQGGKGHCSPEPFIRFYGTEFDCIRAYEICANYGLNVMNARRVFRKTDIYNNDNTSQISHIGYAWDKPFNEIVFCKHSKTGTIFLPH